MLILPRFYSTSTTARLETRARQLGLRLGISYGEGDCCDTQELATGMHERSFWEDDYAAKAAAACRTP